MKALLLDIEGTTTPIEFVHEILFPYARNRLDQFLREHAGEPQVRTALSLLEAEQAAEQDTAAIETYARRLMDQDRKSTGLKSLQGLIWERGYLSGEIRSIVYPDVPSAFARWKRQEKQICIFSSGSLLAQKLLFRHTREGDLTPFLRACFDTTTGPKRDRGSYQRIARAVGLSAPEITFISDTLAELDAARDAGMLTSLCLRPGVATPGEARGHPVIHDFDGISSKP